jgi:hypothetical protein
MLTHDAMSRIRNKTSAPTARYRPMAFRASSDGMPVFSPAACWRFAPIGGCLYRKLLDRFFPFANISLKRNLNTVEKGYFLPQYILFCQKMKINGFICREKRCRQPRVTFG